MSEYKVGQEIRKRNPNDPATYKHGSITAVHNDGGLDIKWHFPSMARHENEFISASRLHEHEIEIVYDPQ